MHSSPEHRHKWRHGRSSPSRTREREERDVGEPSSRAHCPCLDKESPDLESWQIHWGPTSCGTGLTKVQYIQFTSADDVEQVRALIQSNQSHLLSWYLWILQDGGSWIV